MTTEKTDTLLETAPAKAPAKAEATAPLQGFKDAERYRLLGSELATLPPAQQEYAREGFRARVENGETKAVTVDLGGGQTDELIHWDDKTRKWFENVDLDYRLSRVEEGEAVPFTLQQAMENFAKIAAVRAAGSKDSRAPRKKPAAKSE